MMNIEAVFESATSSLIPKSIASSLKDLVTKGRTQKTETYYLAG